MQALSSTNIVLVVMQLLSCVFLICVIILQSGKRSGLSGAIAGVAESFVSKNKARTWDAKLARITKWVAFIFAAITLALSITLKG